MGRLDRRQGQLFYAFDLDDPVLMIQMLIVGASEKKAAAPIISTTTGTALPPSGAVGAGHSSGGVRSWATVLALVILVAFKQRGPRTPGHRVGP